MKAAVWYGGKDFKIEDVKEPKMSEEQALIQVKIAGICGSDLHAYDGSSKRRKPPLVMGHEFGGIVAKVGAKATGVAVGDRVVVNPIIACGACEPCRTGKNHVCENMRLIGLHSSGAFAEYVAVPAKNCIKLPDNVSFEEASMVEPLSVGIHSAGRAGVKIGDNIVIIGPGTIGLTSVMAAKMAGAGKIFITGANGDEGRLALAKKLGADVTINAMQEDPVARILAETGGGADSVIEAVGIQKTIQQAMSMLRRGRNAVIIGLMQTEITINAIDLAVKEIGLLGDYGYTKDDFMRGLGMIAAGKANVKQLITHTFPLEEIAKGFETLSTKEGNAIKVLLRVSK
jgi:L-iditol 2-dehydrogenase